MPNLTGSRRGLSRSTFIRGCLAAIAAAVLPSRAARAQTSTTTTTTTTSGDGTTVVTEETTTGSTAVVVAQPNPLGPAGVGGVARRTSRRVSRRN